MSEKLICDILIRDTDYLTEGYDIACHQDIAIADGKFVDISPAGTRLYEAAEILNGVHKLWMPGLVDGHMHTGQQLLKGAVLDELPMIWTRIMLPFESTMTLEKMHLSASLAALEMIKSGTTGFVDAGGYYMEAAAEEYVRSGLRGVLSCSAMDQGSFPDSIRQTTAEVLASEDALYSGFHGKGNLKVYYALRALMNCSQELIEKTVLHAHDRGTYYQAHMNEYAGEVNYTLQNYQLRPVEYLETLGVLDEHFVAAHGIMLSAVEKSLLAKRGVKIVHCPFSNCGKGVPDTPELLERGISVGLGSDGAAHGGLSLWNEMKILRSVMNAVHGVRQAEPAVMSAKTILDIATRGGAAALGEAGKLGVLKPGYKADLIAINYEQPHLFPTADKVNTLVECVTGGDVTDSIVEGRLLMKNRQVCTLDEERILWQASKYYECGEVIV